MSAHSLQARTASPVTRQFFELLESSGISQSEISDRSKIHVNTIYGWKSGKSAATVLNMEMALSVLGLEMVIRPITSHHPTEELPS